MGYTKLKTQPASLFVGETAIQLDDGTTVAVAVEPTWLENGAGVSFLATARHIDAEGATQLGPHGQYLRTGFTFTADPSQAASKKQISAIAKEMLFALLGEPPTMRTIKGVEIPLLALSDEVRANANIRQHITVAAATGPTVIDVGKVLSL